MKESGKNDSNTNECSESECLNKECTGACENTDYCEMSGMMLCLADKAWEQLMMEKMKQVWDKQRSANMLKAAEASVKHSMAVWMAKMMAQDMSAGASKEEIAKFKKELEAAFKG